jgi:hypothetical protein
MELRPECGQSTKHCNSKRPVHGPSPSLYADFLVVAGGGGGGAGGGGAGGYRTSAGTSGGGASAESSLGLAVGVAYTVTVGAGGAG